ncbi:S8 family peptidase [Deinococcus soli (ex Cha et al. 2016)]|uniref:Subtilisin family serine protease n=2 Tax=Deinococcus soli (ex Cha et al. 2016) TaxID=1309411 RepID=A0ACC6KM24_9DEIO|nr:S8 family peptidase [Deinococcus soli (ex Cha et al. 2016)]MDR6220408.1 subtilisin family serine protease [Deinococcus soli (ex Cha et al. 2016)]MDR6330261.1 subtilisin family serine protease [Deinococcus soli (ex Cha et al. 2016)]MDR6753489.1 subtilisin family serine protease [Deinococcus soli (ex Cha et al. 2016)]
MNARHAATILTLTGLLASCGQQAHPQTALPTTDAASRTRTQAPVLGQNTPEAIPGQYIVVMSAGTTASTLASQSGGLVQALGLDPQGVSILSVYTQALNGFAVKLNAQNLARLQADPRVKYIQQDSVAHATATQSSATWGLDRIDQRDRPLSGTYTYDTTASGVKVYIIDTGIRTSHGQFAGRATWGTNTTGDGQNTDCNGHGTHVAGTVGGSTYGVAKGASLIAVKVLNCSGSGSFSGIISGIDWAVSNKGSATAIANLSLGGGKDQAVNDAVSNANSRGLFMAVAAGNDNRDACAYSPASSAGAFTVGSTDSSDVRSTFSNYGSCVELFGPGTNITSSWYTNDSATNTISGTSMATPHVAGAAALVLAQNTGYSTSQIASALLNASSANKISNVGTGSPNKLLFTNPGSGSTPTPTPGTTYQGTVNAGYSAYEPRSAGYFQYAGGTLKGVLTGPSGTDFDLYLQKWNGSAWADVAAAEGSTSSETITYTAASGYYRWQIYAYSGSGAYSLTETR